MDTTRDVLKRNATATVRKGGSVSLNFRDLGRSAGVKSSSVHYYFPTKGDLLKEIAGEYRERFLAALEEGIASSRSLRQDLFVLIDLFVAAQDSKLACLCGMLATETELLDPQVRSAVNRFFESLQAWIVRRAAARGVAKPAGLPPPIFADLLVSLLEGSLLLSRLEAHKSSLAGARAWIQKITSP
jgi:TetR/AcrR family transcriptional repressor of nem operon